MKLKLSIITTKQNHTDTITINEGINHITHYLDDETIDTVSLVGNYHMNDDEVIFMNGYPVFNFIM